MNSLKIIVEKNLEGLANGDSQLMDYENGQYVKIVKGAVVVYYAYLYIYI